jgi:PadR family transcriptional regulator PadR
MNNDHLKPLSQPVLMILLSVARQPNHDYSIRKQVEHMSQGTVLLSTGTLYGALRRLLSLGWIRRCPHSNSSRHCKQYRIGERGREQLRRELGWMRDFIQLADERIDLR